MRRIRLAFFLIAALGTTLVSAQERVGEIVSIDGSAQIDAFGAGRFIDAHTGDVLYDESVIRTSYETWVTARISGEHYDIAPSTTTRVSTYLSSRRRSAGTGFFSRLIHGIVDALAPPAEEVADFGGRAAEVSSDDDIGSLFVLDTEPDVEFERANEAYETGDYRSAVDHLRRIEYPEDGTYDLVEYYVLLASALLGIGDCDAAIRAAFEYNLAQPDPRTIGDLPERLRILVALGAYYGGEDSLALAAATEYSDAVGLSEADAQVVAIRVLLLRETDSAAAARLERAARSAQPQAPWDRLLDS